MTKENAAALQERIAREAIALMRACESEMDCTGYEEAITLIGQAWDLPDGSVQQQIEQIRHEKRRYRETGERSEDFLKETELPMNASASETLQNMRELLATSLRLESKADRIKMCELAMLLADTQNLDEQMAEWAMVKVTPER